MDCRKPQFFGVREVAANISRGRGAYSAGMFQEDFPQFYTAGTEDTPAACLVPPAMLEELLPLAREFYTITPDSERAMPAAELAAYLEGRGVKATPCGSVREGLELALVFLPPEDVVCVTGSLYMIGEVRHLLGLC